MNKKALSYLPLFILFFSTAAHAYIGPGAAIGILGSILGFSGAMVLAVIFTLAWPLWIVYKKVKKNKETENTTDKTENTEDTSPTNNES